MSEGQKRSRLKHVYVIVRVDYPIEAMEAHDAHNPIDNNLSLVSAFRGHAAAMTELARLRAARPVACHYAMMVTRLEG